MKKYYWHRSGDELPQLKLSITPTFIRPFSIDGPPLKYEKKKSIRNDNSKLWVVVADYQCPYYNEYVHEEVLNFIEQNRPDYLVANGDIIDLPTLSSFTPNPKHDTSVNEGIDSAGKVLKELASVAGSECKKYLLPGNHEQRLETYTLKRCPEFYGIHRAGETESLLSIPYLLNLERLGYEFIVGQYNDWPDGTLKVTDKLYIKHGWTSKAGSGNTVRAAMETLGVSLVLGHIHRGGKVYSTKQLTGQILEGVECPTMCNIVGGLAYATEPDWQNGITIIRVEEDGTFCIDPIIFKNGRLIYNNLR